MLTLKINVMKLQKERFFEGKNGAKYADLIVMELDEPDQYGNTFIVKQSLSKEERQQGVKMPIIGNGKSFDRQPRQSSGRSYQKPTTPPPDDSEPPF
jgi:hypothetical protein